MKSEFALKFEINLPSHDNGTQEKLLCSHLEVGAAPLPGLPHLVEDGVGPEDLVAQLATHHHFLLVLPDTAEGRIRQMKDNIIIYNSYLVT